MYVVVTKRSLAKSRVECHVMEDVAVNVLSEVVVVSLSSDVVSVIIVVVGRCVLERLSVIVVVGSCVFELCL